MHQYQKHSVLWRVTEVLRVSFYILFSLFVIRANIGLYLSDSVSFFQKIISVTGVAVLIMCAFDCIDYFVEYLRKFLRKYIKDTISRQYSKEKIELIRNQMSQSTNSDK